MPWMPDWKCKKIDVEIVVDDDFDSSIDTSEFESLFTIPVHEETKNHFRVYDNPYHLINEGIRWGDLIEGRKVEDIIYFQKIVERCEHKFYDGNLLNFIEDKDSFLTKIMAEGGFWAHEAWFMDSWVIAIPPGFPIDEFKQENFVSDNNNQSVRIKRKAFLSKNSVAHRKITSKKRLSKFLNERSENKKNYRSGGYKGGSTIVSGDEFYIRDDAEVKKGKK